MGANIGNVDNNLLNTWGYYATKIKYTNLNQSISTGKVLVGKINNRTIYRFISSEKDGLYPVDDIFYSNFDGTNLTNIIARR